MNVPAKKSEVVTLEATLPAPTHDGGAMALLRAGATPEQIEKLMILQERWDANQARKAFNEAIADAKAEIKPIVKKQSGHNSKYADLAAIADVVDPILSKHGLGYRHRSAQGDKISVTCILFHKLGHSEETPLEAAPDTSGSKNAIQAIGSTLTYLQRYSLVLALGLATAKDDDAKAAGTGETITDEQVQEISDLLTKTNSNLVKFLEKIKLESLTQIGADKFDAVVKLIKDTDAQRKARAAKQTDTGQ